MSAPGDGPPFELFSSLRYDIQLRQVHGQQQFDYAGWNYHHNSPYYMLDLHRDRLLRAATYWGWESAKAVLQGEQGLQRLEQALDDAVGADAQEPKRCKILLNEQGRLNVEVWNTTTAVLACLFPPQLPSPGVMSMGAPYDVTLDLQTTQRSVHTHYKTTRRQMYDAARQRAGITGAEPREVLLVNRESGTVMDGSITTAYFWRQGMWTTPPVPLQFAEESGSGGLDGTTRRWALTRKMVVEDVVQVDALKDGDECWLSNGVRGFIHGRIRLQ